MDMSSLIVAFGGALAVAFILIMTYRSEKELYKGYYYEEIEKYKKLKQDYGDLSRRHLEATGLYYKTERANYDLQAEIFYLRKKLAEKKVFTPPTENQNEILFAVKKAMMACHPDRGGKQEDFIRINNLYNQLKGGK